jgi:hypothetical protein
MFILTQLAKLEYPRLLLSKPSERPNDRFHKNRESSQAPFCSLPLWAFALVTGARKQQSI